MSKHCGQDVHVDWHMRPDEWLELQAVLHGVLDPADSSYIQGLLLSGALGLPGGMPDNQASSG
jgi:hypothetical protein